MGHKVAEGILDNGKLTQVNANLPKGRIKVHIIYDVEEGRAAVDTLALLRETAGIYKDIDAGNEANKIRAEWERNV